MPKILFWSYDPEVPSFRIRLRPVVEILTDRGWDCRVERFPRGRYGWRVVERRSALRAADLLVVAKINLAPGEVALVRRWASAVAFDFDDAIYLKRPRRRGEPPGRSWLRRRKFEGSCRAADLILAGNLTLAAAVPAGLASRVRVTPTPVNVGRYPGPGTIPRRTRTLVWIGLPENLPYLESLRPVLADLTRQVPDLVLRVVSSRAPEWDDVAVEHVPWTEESQAEALATAGVGLMPLDDDGWTRGKCAFKLLQYMAAGLPCVASPVGTNCEVVVPNETGFLAGSPGEWREALETLLTDSGLASRMGEQGRQRVRSEYSNAVVSVAVADRLEALLGREARGGPRRPDARVATG